MNRPQLFCFTYAGGTAAFYDKLAESLPEFEVVGLEYPGHGTRMKEPLLNTFSEIATDAIEQIQKRYTGGRYALMGYSMGTIALIETLKLILSQDGLNPPEFVILCAHEPDTKYELINFAEAEADELIKERTVAFGGLPEKLISNKSFWRLYLPIYRSDYSAIGNYKFDNLELRTEIPAAILYSQTDISYTRVSKWRLYFIGECKFFRFSGNHFFIEQHYIEISNIIRAHLT